MSAPTNQNTLTTTKQQPSNHQEHPRNKPEQTRKYKVKYFWARNMFGGSNIFLAEMTS